MGKEAKAIARRRFTTERTKARARVRLGIWKSIPPLTFSWKDYYQYQERFPGQTPIGISFDSEVNFFHFWKGVWDYQSHFMIWLPGDFPFNLPWKPYPNGEGQPFGVHFSHLFSRAEVLIGRCLTKKRGGCLGLWKLLPFGKLKDVIWPSALDSQEKKSKQRW